jgi:hypothetical protein
MGRGSVGGSSMRTTLLTTATLLALVAGSLGTPAAGLDAGSPLDGTAGAVRLRHAVPSVTDLGLAEAQRDGVPPLPEDAVGIGPGSPLLTTIPGEGTFICTANFVFKTATKWYLGAAGHCFLPESRKATHGTGADYNAGGVVTEVCVDFCFFGGQLTGFLGDMRTLGPVAYARQTGPGGDIGNDFGVVEVPPALVSLLRPEMPMWDGPTGANGNEGVGTLLAHYGNGIDAGTFVASKGRTGTGLSDGAASSWQANLVINGGDSGSAVVHAAPSASADAIAGTSALGVVTHGIITGVVPLAWGTSIEQALSMATQANLQLQLVLEGGATGGGQAVPVHVAAIDTAAEHYGNNKGHRVTTTVTVRDGSGALAPGVTVSIDVDTPTGRQSGQGTTDSTGKAAITVQVSGATAGHGTWTSCVTSLSGAGYSYNPAANAETCQSQAVN